MNSIKDFKIEREAVWVQYLIGAALIYSLFMLSFCQQSDFACISLYGLSAFVSYFFLIAQKPTLSTIFIVGLLARALLINSFPTLSDDIFRFIWDGRITAAGHNPYSYLPTDILDMQIHGLDNELLDKLNSPNYYTIYPPVSQFLFWLSSAFTNSLYTSSLILKCIFLVAELLTFIGMIKILRHLGRPCWLAAIYWLSPLIIIEGIGNLHFEIIMISCLVWSIIYLFIEKKPGLGALLFALSIAAKLLPLMLLPYIAFRSAKKDMYRFFSVLCTVLFALFVPILLGVQVGNFASSIDLYFQKFEFNASIYYVLRYIGQQITGYNLIHYLGPALGLITIGIIIKLARKGQELHAYSFIHFSLLAFTAYLLLATTVHPWYLCTPIMLSVFVKYKYAIVWSALVLLTYINYSFPSYHEHMGIVAFEYGLVTLFMLYEWSKSNTISQRQSS